MARCYSVIVVGTQDFEWKGEKKSNMKVRITWELPTETIEYDKDGKKITAPMVIGNEYTFSMSEKANLRKVVEDMIGTTLREDEAEGFDIYKLIGMPCLISIVHNTKGDRTYANIGSITPLMEGITVPPQVNQTVKFDISQWDQGVFDSLPGFIKERIMESHEKRPVPKPKEPIEDIVQYPDEDINPEDIPF